MIDINFLKNIALQSGKIAMTYFGKVKVQVKKDNTPLTEADLQIDRFLTQQIREKYPDHLILSEEMGSVKRKGTETVVWVIDPVDGTASFASGLSVWGISIGVLINDVPLFGVVYLPVTDELYYSDGKKSFLREKVIKADDFIIDSNSFFAVPSDAHKSLDLKGFIGKTRSMGSIAAHMCYVAKGIAIGAVMKPHIWDIGGGSAILNTGGSEISYLDGEPVDWKELYSCKRTKNWCIAGKKDKIKVLREIVKGFD